MTDNHRETEQEHRAGTVAIVGRPNTGKSTLLNRILGLKLSIVSKTAQTTRNRILGIHRTEKGEIAFLDTPGLHEPRGLLGEQMMREATQSAEDVDLLVWLIDPRVETKPHHRQSVLPLLVATGRPIVMVMNKIDRVPRQQLLPLMGAWGEAHSFTALIPISAIHGDGIETLLNVVYENLPVGPPAYDEDTLTDRPERFLVAEIIREKVFRLTGQEIPHTTAVSIEHWEEEEGRVVIFAKIVVERDSQKGIVIGKGGSRIKAIGQKAREDIQRLLERRVHLETRVVVDPSWPSRPERVLHLGYYQ